jgi:hypothetical protein
MRPKHVQELLGIALDLHFPVMLVGPPGVGKTDMVMAAARQKNADVILAHPVVDDPTDYKGLPFAANGEANFLPYGNIRRARDANKPTFYFLDDFGQASNGVQAAAMQPILSHTINGIPISPYVVFVVATNRKEDKAAVSGILEPVKSRFKTIIDVEVHTDDWISWALANQMPVELIAFIRYRENFLTDFKPTKDIKNNPCPRTITNVGIWQNSGLPAHLQYETFKGAAGEAFATEYKSFLDVWKQLPNIDKIFMAPDTEKIPDKADVLYATIGAIASRVNDLNANNAFRYIKRLPEEVQVACVSDILLRDKNLTMTKGYQQWSIDNGNWMMND